MSEFCESNPFDGGANYSAIVTTLTTVYFLLREKSPSNTYIRIVVAAADAIQWVKIFIKIATFLFVWADKKSKNWENNISESRQGLFKLHFLHNTSFLSFFRAQLTHSLASPPYCIQCIYQCSMLHFRWRLRKNFHITIYFLKYHTIFKAIKRKITIQVAFCITFWQTFFSTMFTRWVTKRSLDAI